MKKYAKMTPEGTRDILFDECAARRGIEKELSRLFQLRGFHRVFTPTIEFFDVFDGERSGMQPESMYKLVDSRGRLLVLRPDSTIPIARMAATRLKGMPLPLRLYYTQNVFRSNPVLTGHSDEISQSGIELIGASGMKADLEILHTAVSALKVSGSGSFRFEIGHAWFFGGLLKALEAEEETKEEITRLFETKNYVVLNELLDGLAHREIAECIRALPRMFGGAEILREAEKMVSLPECRQAVDYLTRICAHLTEMELEAEVTIDLGLVHRTHYYNGVLFRGYVEGSGVTVLSGGRYDQLIQEFGADLPAIGFGVDVEALTAAALQQKDVQRERVPERLVYAELPYEMQALRLLLQWGEQGIVCENSVHETLEEAVAYARQKGIGRVEVVDGKGVSSLSVTQEEEK